MESRESGGRASDALRRHGLLPRKSLGQHFLRDRSYLAKILDAARVGPEDEVAEVGAGTGVLTTALAQRARRVVAIELDDALAALLSEELVSEPTVGVWHGNALEFDPSLHFEGQYKVLGNIPYYVTGPIVRHFLEVKSQPVVLVLMVQREVAERMAAPAGKLSVLGVSVQFYAHPEVVASVPANAFYPRPKVDSAIVRLTPYRRAVSDESRQTFFRVVKAGFSAPRKQLTNSLGSGLGIVPEEARSLLGTTEIDGTRRAETLSIEEWDRLATVWSEAFGRG